MVRSWGWVLLVVMTMQSAYADPATATTTSAPPRRALYVELLGKGGTWGLGYTHQVHRRIGIGALGSYTVLSDQRMFTFSPSLTVYPLGVRSHRLFVDAGPQLVHLRTPSPVPEWMGTSETGIGAQLSTGYEYRGAIFARLFVMGVAGKSGVAPWLGMDLGWAF
ncbi:MAG: hypothetical protein H0T42_07150 [Deltaproteobacteria bacterium]|nr:hypothetical protein [Deltaproteobacteria bacterium]